MANERRLIDANDFLAELKERHENIMQDPEVSKRMKWCEAVHYGATTAIIDELPTIDAVVVTRCKDCKLWDMFGIEGSMGKCVLHDTRMDEGDFCSYGERRDKDAVD